MKDITNIKDLIQIIKEEKKFLLIIMLITLLAYANVIRGEFVTADDIPGIVQNTLTRDLGGSLKTLNIYVIKNAIIYQFAGLNSSVYHITSIVTHLINIVLVFAFIRTLFDKKTAILGTIVFALHPVNSETVSWLSANPYGIDGSITLIILILFLLYRKTNKKVYWITSIGVYLLMITHDKGAWPLVIPFVIAIIDQFILSKKFDFKKGIILILPFILIAGTSAYLVIGQNYNNRVDALVNQYYFDPKDAPPLLNRMPMTIYPGIRYLVFPYELNIYPGEKLTTQQDYTWMAFVTVSFFGLLIYLCYKHRVYAGLILAILASIAPTLSPIQVAWLMTERYLYLGSVFFAILVALLFQKIKDEKVLKFSFGLLLVLYIVRIIFRTEDWRTNKNLWISTLRFSPMSYRVYNNLGDVYIKEGNYDKAIESFKKSFEIFPGYADAMHNTALVYMYLNDIENAKKYMLMALQTKPTLIPALEKMGIIYMQEGDYIKAKPYFQRTLELSPSSDIAQKGLQTIKAKGL